MYLFKQPSYITLLFVVSVAVIIQVIVFHRNLPSKDISKDSESAINRAKTPECKKELYAFALKLAQDSVYPRSLSRSCPLDQDPDNRISFLGCISASESNLTYIEDVFTDGPSCLNLCYSYGYSHGGYNRLMGKCYCGESSVPFYTSHTDVNNDTNICDQDRLEWFVVNNGTYYPNKVPTLLNASISQVRIAFLLSLNGKSSIQVRRLLRNVYSKKHVYYIHVDNRENVLFEDLLEYERRFDNIILTKTRLNTIWGGSSLLSMVLNAMLQLRTHEWDYLINLSESDFPIKSLAKLEHYLTTHFGSIYLKTHSIKGYNFIKKQGLDWSFYQCENRSWRMGRRHLPRGVIYSGGSDWFALPKDFCTYVLDNRNKESSLVHSLLRVFNHTLLPVESFFHTLAMNSEFCDKLVDNNLRVTNWQRKQSCKCQHKDVVDWCGCSPLVYRLSDWEKLKRTNTIESLFFSRKFDPTISSSIINLVEENLVRDSRVQENYHPDNRYWIISPDSARVGTYLWTFGRLVFQRLALNSKVKNGNFHVQEKVYLHFNYDRFIGIILQYCNSFHCVQTLVVKRMDNLLKNYRHDCFDKHSRRLKAIEINQDFDTGERIFRNYMPLNRNSDIVVYHEWLVQGGHTLDRSTSIGIQFLWRSPNGGNTTVQNIKLRETVSPNRLVLAHRMNIKRPIEAGLWQLTARIGTENCFDYEFLVFDSSDADHSTIDYSFNKLYKMVDSCQTYTNSDHSGLMNMTDCENAEWSLDAMRSVKLEHSNFEEDE